MIISETGPQTAWPAIFRHARASGGPRDGHRSHQVAHGEFATTADWRAKRDTALPLPRAAATLMVELADSGVYSVSFDVVLDAGESVWIAAALGTRPVLWLTDLRVEVPMRTPFTAHAAAASRSTVYWWPNAASGVRGQQQSDDDDLAANDAGDLGSVLIRHCTLVLGWELNHDCKPKRPAEPSIVLDGARVCLSIEYSIVGASRMVDGQDETSRARINIADRIVDATSSIRAEIAAPDSEIAAAQLCTTRTTMVTTVHVQAPRAPTARSQLQRWVPARARRGSAR